MKRHSLWLAVITALLGTGYATAFDEIRVSGRPVQTGTIKSMSPTEVVLEANGRRTPYNVNEIVDISFDLEPLELKTARRLVGSGQYEMALGKLKAIDQASVSRDVILQDIAFYKAYAAAKLALGGGGNKNEATAEMVAFWQNNKTNYHYFEAVETLGDLAVAISRYDTAAKFYAQLADAPWGSHQLRALVLEGRALEAQNKHKEALPKYEKVLTARDDVPGAPEQKLFAVLGKAACLAAMKQYDDGIKIVQTVIDRGDPSDIALFARAYNTLGRCYLLSDRPKDALLAYLRTDILFYGDPESHAEALYHLNKLWQQVNRPERAREANNLLKERYGGSQWARKE
jgi:tetratricopeptide (TPR) repeat protein